MDMYKNDWAKIAAWTFGAWSLMIPIAAGIIVSYQNKIIESQDKYRTELAQLRVDLLTQNNAIGIQVAGILARQLEVMRRVDLLEEHHLTGEYK